MKRSSQEQPRFARQQLRPGERQRAVHQRNAALARLGRARVVAVGAAGFLSLAFAALAHAFAPGHKIDAGAAATTTGSSGAASTANAAADDSSAGVQVPQAPYAPPTSQQNQAPSGPPQVVAGGS